MVTVLITKVILVMVITTAGATESSTLLEVGSCPIITSQPDLDLQQLAGRWHHILHFPSEDQPDTSCTRSSYTYTPEEYLEVVTAGRDGSGRNVSRTGVLGHLPQSSTGALQLDMDQMPPLTVWVVHTDYRRLLCLYSCVEFPGLRAEWAWALTRNPRPLVKLVTRCRAKLRKLKVNTDKFKRVVRTSSCRTDNESQSHS